ncbi:IS3 family transposase [Pediococcus inopinatus]|uniref:IS3 family transposase n=1 Tax=Pediococcus inopinatus TaxID=114090 RepID=UPI003367AA35
MNEVLSFILKVVGMSSSSYHDALNRQYKTNYSQDLVDEILQIRRDNPDFGYRTVTDALRNNGKIVNHKVVLKIMKQNDVLCHAFDRKTRKYNSYRGTVGKLAKNKLNRRFNTDRPYQKVVTDVTEVRWGSGSISERAYFTSFVDLYSNEILSWNIGLSPNVAFVTKPLMDLIRSKPQLPYKMTIHSDQGFQYQNYQYVSKLKKNHIMQSMSRKATCLDNAVAESCFHILKVGTVHNNHYSSYEELRIAITEYVSYYNNKRIRTKLAGKTPVQYRNLSDQLVA